VKLPSGLQLIRAERRRQKTREGWTAKHDDSHTDGTLMAAARCYERCAQVQAQYGEIPRRLASAYDFTPKNWPWEPQWFKLGGTAVRTLVKAGALFQAEVDRLQRLEKRATLSGVTFTEKEFAKQGVLRCAARIDDLQK
jgi:hypothetical protein